MREVIDKAKALISTYDQLLEHTRTERDALAADNARLRKALDAAFEGAARQLAEPRHHGNDQYALTAIATTCELAFAITPAQSLTAHDAALLREVADGVDKIAVVPTIDTPQSMRDLIADAIRAKADRIEKEAANG